LTKGYFRWENDRIPPITAMATARMVTQTASFETPSFSISRPLPITVGFNCGDSVRIQWPTLDGAQAYRVFSFTGMLMEELATVTDTAFIFKKGDVDATIFSVQPMLANGSAIRSPAYDFTSLGTGCFIFSFRDEVIPDEGIYLNVELGTTYGVDQLIVERQSSRGFQPVEAVTPGLSNTFRILDETPLNGYNYYRLRLQLKNGQVENFFVGDKAFFIFPNPVAAGETLRVFSKVFQDAKIIFRLYSADGVLVTETALSSDREFISLQQFRPGLYLYSIQSEEGYSKGKIVVTP
jgi:hypothetical protein